jgi:hypothetical protein
MRRLDNSDTLAWQHETAFFRKSPIARKSRLEYGPSPLMRYARLLTLCLSALIQLWTPLAHAHPAAGESGRPFHLPGLEYLERLQGEEGWHAPAMEEESSMVVAIQSGIMRQSRVSPPRRPDRPAAVTVAYRIETQTRPLALAKGVPSNPSPYDSPATKPPSARGPPR